MKFRVIFVKVCQAVVMLRLQLLQIIDNIVQFQENFENNIGYNCERRHLNKCPHFFQFFETFKISGKRIHFN